ncbi:MAG: SH3 domain-containing protein [Lachnospiraceae bacterium]|nr:SH3 domain-containing protein [Lachnospiraceae bacterium]
MAQNRRDIRAICGRILRGVAAAAGIVFVLWRYPLISLADSTGTVKVDSVKIRENADATSEVIGSASRGAKVSIREEAQDASGALWYQVVIDANKTGYIRADLIDKEGGDSSLQSDTSTDGSAAGTSSGDGQAPSGATAQPHEPMDVQYATVHVEAIKVRSAPSTNDTVVDRLVENAQVVISGKSEGSDGKDWYYVTFTGTGNVEKTGFIRADLLTLGDMVPVSEEEEQPQEPEQPQETQRPVNNDYELIYESEPDGSYAWYLYDHTQGGSDKKRVDQILAAANMQPEDTEEEAKTLVKQRIAIVALVVLAVLLIIAVIIMALKLRDVYYEDYEDDEEDEEEPETEGASRRRQRAQEDEALQERKRDSQTDARTARSSGRREEREDEETPRRRRSQETEEPSGRRRRRSENEEEAEAEQRQARRRQMRDEREEEAAAANAPKRKTKNFLLDDDEFEFEFLSMDDRE